MLSPIEEFKSLHFTENWLRIRFSLKKACSTNCSCSSVETVLR